MKKQAKSSKRPNRFCSLPKTPERRFAPSVSPGRARAIVDNQAKWVNGTTLNYFFDGGPSAQRAAVRKGFKAWEDVGIGLKFSEVTNRDGSQIRIAFEDDGSWSYVGRTVLTIPKSDATMNFGWDITSDVDTAIHEIGHTLGMPHEHQNPFAGIVWDEEKVYASLAAPPNGWSRQETHWNIIRKIPESEVKGTAWDPNSIMHYPFEAGLIKEPVKYAAGLHPAGGLSKLDKEWIKETYPPMPSSMQELQPFVSQVINIKNGGQANYLFKPTKTGKFTIKTFGATDSVVVVAEESKAGQAYLQGVDDSGEDHNGEIETKLEKGKVYSIRVRLLYKEPESQLALMVW
jgi:hypothetical protein